MNRADIYWSEFKESGVDEDGWYTHYIEIAHPLQNGTQQQVWDHVIHESVALDIHVHTGLSDTEWNAPAPLHNFSMLSQLALAHVSGMGCDCDTRNPDEKGTVYGTDVFLEFREFMDACCRGDESVIGKSIYTTLELQNSYILTTYYARMWWRLDCHAKGNTTGNHQVALSKGGNWRSMADDYYEALRPTWWPDGLNADAKGPHTLDIYVPP